MQDLRDNRQAFLPATPILDSLSDQGDAPWQAAFARWFQDLSTADQLKVALEGYECMGPAYRSDIDVKIERMLEGECEASRHERGEPLEAAA